jgi:hypothetical protein
LDLEPAGAPGLVVAGFRLVVMTEAAIAMLSSIPAALSSNVMVFTLLIALSLAGHGAWFTNPPTLPADVFNPGLVASLYGITGLGAAWAARSQISRPGSSSTGSIPTRRSSCPRESCRWRSLWC